MSFALDLHLQASTPSNHLWSAFLLPAPPQFLCQAPPGAQQLTLSDFRQVILLEEMMASVLVLNGVVIGVRAIGSSRLFIGRRGTYQRTSVVRGVHTFRNIDPREAVNMFFFICR